MCVNLRPSFLSADLDLVGVLIPSTWEAAIDGWSLHVLQIPMPGFANEFDNKAMSHVDGGIQDMMFPDRLILQSPDCHPCKC